MALQIRGNTQIMQASVSLDRLDSNGGSLHGAVTINSLSSSNATISGGSATNLSNLTSSQGTISGRLAHTGDSAGTKFSSPMVDISGGTLQNTTMTLSDVSIDTGKSLSGQGSFIFDSASTLSFANDQISGDVINGGTIDSVGIDYGTLTNSDIKTSDIDIDAGKSLEIKTGGSFSGQGSFTFDSASSLSFANDQISGDKIANGSLTDIAVDGSLNLSALSSAGELIIGSDMISGNSIHGGDISGSLVLSGDTVTVSKKLIAGNGGFIVDSSGHVTAQNLTVQGTTTTVNSETIELADNFILLNSNLDSGGFNYHAGIEVKRSVGGNVKLEWDESNDRWTVGSEKLVSGEFIGDVTGNVSGNLKGDVLFNNGDVLLDQSASALYGYVMDSSGGSIILNHQTGALAGNAATSSQWLAPRVVTFAGGDVHGTFSIDGSANVDSVGLTIQPQSLEFSMLSTNAYLSVDSGGDTGWDGASDSQLVTALDVKEYVDNSTASGLAAQALSFKIGTGTAMTNVKYQIEDITAELSHAGTETIDLSVAVVSSYETLADVYMNGQKLRYGSDNSSGDYYFSNDDAGARKRINFNSINIEVGDVIEAKYFIAE